MVYLNLISGRKGQAIIEATGAWTVSHTAAIENAISGFASTATKSETVEINLAKVDEFDTYGACLLERLDRELKDLGKTVKFTGTKPRDLPLLREVSGTGKDHSGFGLEPARPDADGEALSASLSRLVISFFSFFVMLGALIAAAGRTIRHPAAFRFTSTINQFDRVCWKALPIVLMVTFIIGAIIAQQGFFHFRKVSAPICMWST